MTGIPGGSEHDGQRVFGGDDYGPSDWREPAAARPPAGAPARRPAQPQPQHQHQHSHANPRPMPRGPEQQHPGQQHPGRPPAPGPAPARPRRRGLVAGLVAAGLVVVLAGGAALWEWQARGSAAEPFVEALQAQNLVVDGADASIAASGGHAGGGLAAIESLGDRWSRLDLDAVVTTATAGEFAVDYELHGAPTDGAGRIDEAVLTTSLPPEAVQQILYGTRNPFENAEVEFVDGRYTVRSTNEWGGVIVSEFEFSAVDGEFRREIIRAELDGASLLENLDETVSLTDWCEHSGLDSTLEELTITDDALTARWRIADLDVGDLALAICLG
ncbi:MAG: hypothetical protein GXX90_06125 [Microbacteriaceae bacterium]|nr:hypothetical protein [Microbacteriaceae bacterium]